MNCLHTFKHDVVRRVTEYISPPSFMFVSAAVSEIRKLNQKKKGILKLAISNLTPFLGIKVTHFLTRGTF